MRRAWRVVRLIGVGLVALLLLLTGGLATALWETLPPTHQRLRIPGLHGPVAVTIDEHGVPRIQAGTMEDAAAATGFLHARDRMFQMELTRRVGSGRIAELAGPAGLPTDRTMRTLGIRRLCDAAVPLLPAPTRALLEAYSRGVNAAIAARGRFIAPEFLLLGRPEPWTAADSLLWGRLMSLSLSDNYRVELARLAAASASMPIDRLLQLWPGGNDTPPPQATLAPITAGLPRLASLLNRALPRFPEPYTLPDEASDEWAVDGAHSSTGAPLLAGDPHLAFGFPALWYLLRIDVPGYSLTGASAPGIPFLVIGQNGHIAWTFTSNSADTQDLFAEAPVDKDRYATPNGPQLFTSRREVIHVRGAPDAILTVRSTRHGPVISDVLGPRAGGHVLAVAMESLRPEDAAPGLAALDLSRDVDEAGRAATLISSPVQNLLVADRQRIALFTTGHVPIRRSGDGSVPATGAGGSADWIDDADSTRLPRIVAAPSGHLLNGNERTAPANYPIYMGRDWPGSWRADRIRALLQATSRHDVADFSRMQSDQTSAFAQSLLPRLLDRPLRPPSGSAASTALDLLRTWSGRMDQDRPQPLIFNAWIQRFVSDTLTPGDADFAAGPWEDVAAYLLTPAGAIWCNGNCDARLLDALEKATAQLVRLQGAEPSRWRWGGAHHAVFDNAFLHGLPVLRWFGRREIAVGGDDSTLLRTGNGVLGDFSAVHGGAYRGVYDLADPERSRFIVTPGQSGNWLSSNTWNLMQEWAGGGSMQIGRTPAHTVATLSLVP